MNPNDTFRSLSLGLPEDILRRKLHGDLEGAIRLIDRRMGTSGLTDSMMACLTVQREIMQRTPHEYPFTREEAICHAQKHIAGFTEDEFDQLVDEGRIGWVYYDGQMYIIRRFLETLCKTHPDLAVRLIDSSFLEESSAHANGLLNETMTLMKKQCRLQKRIRIRASIRMKDELFEPDMFVRVHLPIPVACAQQSDIRIERVFPASGQCSPDDAAQRTVCWEERMAENHAFEVVYSYLYTAAFIDPDSMVPSAEQPDFCTQEELPHIVFSPFIHSLVKALTADTNDPLEKARRFYDYITLNMKYSFMPAYFIMENIAENCARNQTGDCGVFALLFITLCRCAGIPAQWQSGLVAEPDFCGCHDWARFYIAPYGWLYADPSYGTGAVREENEERRRFYFANLDPYRMVANNAFQQPFTIPKEHWRADPYDNQIGEMETATYGLKTDEFDAIHEVLQCDDVQGGK